MLTTDITRPLGETGGVINEVNHYPNLRSHYATETPPRDAAGAIIDHLLPAPIRGRIPLLAVTGTNGKTTTCRLLHRVFTEAGYCTGSVTSTVTRVGDEVVLNGDYANTVGARAILQDPWVEAAVLETSRGGIISKGLGWDDCDVAVVTNISEDHLGQNGIETLELLAEVKAMIVELARKAVVLNADNAFCRGMAARASAAVWWVSIEPLGGLLQDHLAAGGNALLLEGEGSEERIVHCHGVQRRDILPVADLPCALGGIARHNIENALAASAAGLAFGLSVEILQKALSGFVPSFADSPARLNIRDVDGVRIVMDYAHNMDGVVRVGTVLSKMPVAGQRIARLITWGRRRDDFFSKLAASAAPYFDRFVVTEAFREKNPRPVGEAAAMIKDGLVAAGVAPEAVTVEPDEAKAVDAALALVQPGDLLLIVPDKYQMVWDKVQAFRLDQAAPA